MKIGEGGRNLTEERFLPPSPNPIPSLPKTFALIESLSAGFPYMEKRENTTGHKTGHVDNTEKTLVPPELLPCPLPTS